jgi:DNA-directed RNA polymerase specialized sigma subunit
MTRHRERWERFKLHGDQTAREELIKEFVALVHYVVGRMSLYLPTVIDNEDLIAVGRDWRRADGRGGDLEPPMGDLIGGKA